MSKVTPWRRCNDYLRTVPLAPRPFMAGFTPAPRRPPPPFSPPWPVIHRNTKGRSHKTIECEQTQMRGGWESWCTRRLRVLLGVDGTSPSYYYPTHVENHTHLPLDFLNGRQHASALEIVETHDADPSRVALHPEGVAELGALPHVQHHPALQQNLPQATTENQHTGEDGKEQRGDRWGFLFPLSSQANAIQRSHGA